MQNTEKHHKINRREILGWSLLLSAGAFLIKILDIGFRFSKPMAAAGEFGSVITVGDQSSLPAPGDAPQSFRDGRFFLVNSPQGILALYQACTHLDCLLYWDEESREFVCPCHASAFNLYGDYLRGPAPRGMDRFPVQVFDQENNLIAETDDQVGNPLIVPGQTPQPSSTETTVVETEIETDSTESAALRYTIKVNTTKKIAGRPSAMISGEKEWV